MTRLRFGSALLAWALLTANARATWAQGQPATPDTGLMAAAFPAAVAVAAGNPELAVARAVLGPRMNAINGDIAEALARTALRAPLEVSGNWHSLQARTGPQGIDDLLVQFDQFGQPCDLLVSETKYGSARFGNTVDGRQMGRDWVRHRLGRTAQRYDAAANWIERNPTLVRQRPADHVSSERDIPIPMRGGKSSVLWQDGDGGRYLECARADRGAAAAQARRLASHVRSYTSASVAPRLGLIHVEDLGSAYHVEFTPLRWNAVGNPVQVQGTSRSLPLIPKTIAQPEIEKVLASALSKDPQFTQAQVQQLAKAGAREITIYGSLNRSLLRTHAMQVGLGGFTGVVLDPLIRLADGAIAGRSVSTDELARGMFVAGGSAAAGTAAGLITQAAMVRAGAGLLAIRVVPINAGFGVGAIVYAYGGALLGLHDWKQAHLQAGIGLAGSAVGAGVGFATTMAIAAYGSASTGTAIATLGGAAQLSATLAWLGGGSLAAGGGGMALGAVVLSGGVALVGVVATAALTAAWSYYVQCLQDEAEVYRLELMLSHYRDN